MWQLQLNTGYITSTSSYTAPVFPLFLGHKVTGNDMGAYWTMNSLAPCWQFTYTSSNTAEQWHCCRTNYTISLNLTNLLTPGTRNGKRPCSVTSHSSRALWTRPLNSHACCLSSKEVRVKSVQKRDCSLPVLLSSPVITLPPMLHTRIHLNTDLSEGQAGTVWELSNKAILFRASGGALGTKLTSFFCF